jgi:O-succinylbenzoate synthase
MLPDLADVLSGVRVVALPLVTRFRGITVREAALWEGPAGWTEFSPFIEYGDDEAAHWLAAAYDFGGNEPPAGRRNVGRVRVNATIPATAASGAQPIIVTVAGVASQTGVTVNVQ